ncbi:hypothetical protein G3570_00070 [Balneolaceae bacterium YR4-1]|uniref:Uncharacterized protein n=2 Tax=Halalkalibaculum roseum TaxID=2709311 RepID=A0A6M1SJ27_9BACT|nr:hypothetical protein [Halalkalibaculum roseum]
MMLASLTTDGIAQDLPSATVDGSVVYNDFPVTENNNNDEIARLQRGLHGMTLTFIRFAQEQEIDAFKTGKWTGTFLTRHTDEVYNPSEFLEWMKDELAMHDVSFEVVEETTDRIEASRGHLLTRDKLPWFYRYDITPGEYEDFYHGALVEIANAYGVSYTQKQEGDQIILTIEK